ncbi:hypothetical protein [Granulicella mallensis]|uniref:Uncharacterized protein n=1 Tax=Granulicella mallensis TaxID=940614 RepID=A0A7W7ZNY0_9BACT|nr:hypothetical protein [Granulicella mallensis]MBB5063042.1 hypothetical protein [Granulicella mallensis]
MNELAELAMNAHGGIKRWREFKQMSAHQLVGGVLWSMKGQDGVINDSHVTVDLHREWASHTPFTGSSRRSVLEPLRVAIESSTGDILKERLNPRKSFEGHTLETPWDDLQLAYFAGYAMWTYLTTPFLFALPGVESEELEPWQENGTTWRRLKVLFPDTIETHSKQQIFYFDQSGLLQRHDYDVDIAGSSPAAHYTYEHKVVEGIVIPVKHRVFIRRPDNTPLSEPLVVSVDLDDIKFS